MGDQDRLALEFRAAVAAMQSSRSPPQTDIWSKPSPLPSEFPFNLCAYCRSLKLTVSSFAVPPGRADVEGHCRDPALITRKFANVADFALRHCPLCRLVVQAFRSVYPKESEIREAECEFRLHVNRLDHNPKKFAWRVLRVLLRYGEPVKEADIPTVELLPVVSGLAPDYFIGLRIDPVGLDYTTIRIWLATCMSSHGEVCRSFTHDSRFATIAPYFRVIDIKKRCLCTLPPGYRYFALSYVWGDCDDGSSLVLLQSNISALHSPGALERYRYRQPLVVRDAFDFLSILGVGYLWVDRLCIVQDSEEEKSKIIDKMDLVYANAGATIFAAAGPDANTGLPGVRLNSRCCQQLIDEVGPGLELMVPRNLDNLLSSTWASRGWTYQEFFFSKRRLIFIDGQIVYSCHNGYWTEDLVRPYDTPLRKLFSISGPSDWQPPIFGRPLEAITRRSSYMDYVQAFTKRELRYEADALRAFAGIIDYMTNEVDLKTYFGLPWPTLVLDILWQPYFFLKRRRNFPSWSWAGWKRSILMSRVGQTLMPGVQNIRKRYNRSNAFLARLFFIPVYIYDDHRRLFRLMSCDVREDTELSESRSNREALADMPLILQSSNPTKHYPALDVRKEWALDPRSEQLKPIFSFLESDLPKRTIWIPSAKASRMSSQILLFQTLTAHVSISAFDETGSLCGPFPTAPTRQSSITTAPCIYVYDRHGSRIGLGWLCVQDLFARLAHDSTKPQQSSLLSTTHQQVEISLLSGPITGSWRHEHKGTGLEEGLLDIHHMVESGIRRLGYGHRTEADMAADQSNRYKGLVDNPAHGVTVDADEDEETAQQDLKYCQAMLLKCTDCDCDLGCKLFQHHDGYWHVKERIGLCEIREDVVVKLQDIAWRTVLLQ